MDPINPKYYYYTVLQGSEYVDRKSPIFSLDARVQALLQNYCLHLKIFAFLDLGMYTKIVHEK